MVNQKFFISGPWYLCRDDAFSKQFIQKEPRDHKQINKSIMDTVDCVLEDKKENWCIFHLEYPNFSF